MFDPEKVERRMPQQLFGPKWVLESEYQQCLQLLREERAKNEALTATRSTLVPPK